MTSEEFLKIIDSHRRHLSDVDKSMAEVQALLEGLSSAEKTIHNALNPPSQTTSVPSPQSMAESMSDVGELLDELQFEGK